MAFFSEQKQLDAARQLFTQLATLLNRRISVQLWDGSLIPLGENSDSDDFISIAGPGVLGSMMRRPSYENLLFHYAHGNIGIHGALIDFMNLARQKTTARSLEKGQPPTATQNCAATAVRTC